jgi:hypothetical protein
LKIYFILALVTLFSGCAIQKNSECKYSKDETDPFTNSRIRETYTSFDKEAQVLFRRTNDNYNVVISYYLKGLVKDSLKRTDSLLIKKESGAIISMPLNSCIYSWRKRLNQTLVFIEYDAEQQALTSLARDPITYIRVSAGMRKGDFQNQRKRFKKNSSCRVVHPE